jgi:hypothetical protein
MEQRHAVLLAVMLMPLSKFGKPRVMRLVISCSDMAPVRVDEVICASSDNK